MNKPSPNHNRWIFTFGANSALRDRYVVIHGTVESSREEMFKRHPNWAFQYPDEESAGVKRWGLKELKLDESDN